MKKNKFFSLIAVCLSAIIPLMSFAACGLGRAKKAPNTAGDIEIIYWNSGHGVAFLDNIVEAFKAKPENSDINVYISASAEISTLPIYTATERNTADLYFINFATFLGYKEYLEPMTDILNAKVDGNDVTIAEKLDASVLENLKSEDGTLYSIPWGNSANGLVYNKQIFDERNYEVPRTTDELTNLALKITADLDANGSGKKAFIHLAEYWRYLYFAWWAQMDGTDVFFDTWRGNYRDEQGVLHENDVRAFTDENGRIDALEVLYSLLSPKNYVYPGSNTLSHTTSQTRFLNGDALMMPNGSWVENEMKDIKNPPEIAIMKTPVISSLGKKLGITDDSEAGLFADEVLSTIIKYVDGEELTALEMSVVEKYDDSIIEEVRKARGIYYTEMPQFHTIMPNYSNAKDASKKFLKFFYSDEALNIMANTYKMTPPAKLSTGVDINTTGWTNYSKSCHEMQKTGTPIYAFLSTKLFYSGGIRGLFNYNPATYFTYTTNSTDLWNVQKYWTNESNWWSKEWPNILQKANI